jgi:hypothetical protein
MEKLNGLLSDIFDKRILNKYTNLLPKHHSIYYYFKIDELSCGFIFYIADQIQDLTKTKLNTDLIVGYITGFINTTKIELDDDDLGDIMENIYEKLDRTPYKRRVLNAFEGKKLKLNLDEKQLLTEVKTRLIPEDITISFVSVNEQYLGKGIGQFLMLLASDFAKNKYGIQKIALDDDSDNAWNLERNMYLKLGLWYINEEPLPEMEGLLDRVLKNWPRFKTYYTDKIRKSWTGKPFIPYFIN